MPKPTATTKPQRRKPRGAKEANARLAACYGLLARAAMDLGPKAVGSSKISRALEDVCAVRNVLAEISGLDRPMKRRLRPQSIDYSFKAIGAGDEAAVRQIVFQSAEAYQRNWDYHVKLERKHRRVGERPRQ